eukprot:247397-Chlamydomonas_euryale.AAC.2
MRGFVFVCVRGWVGGWVRACASADLSQRRRQRPHHQPIALTIQPLSAHTWFMQARACKRACGVSARGHAGMQVCVCVHVACGDAGVFVHVSMWGSMRFPAPRSSLDRLEVRASRGSGEDEAGKPALCGRMRGWERAVGGGRGGAGGLSQAGRLSVGMERL